MFNRQNKKNRRKENNKGFSLVELIVVIAIMAVLVAVLAPQFTKYIDQSRKSNDAATVSGIVTAVQVGLVDSEYSSEVNTKYVVRVDSSGTNLYKGSVDVANKISPRANDSSDKTLADAIKDSCGDLSKLKSTSKEWSEIDITFNVSKEGGVTVTYSSDFASYVGATATE